MTAIAHIEPPMMRNRDEELPFFALRDRRDDGLCDDLRGMYV